MKNDNRNIKMFSRDLQGNLNQKILIYGGVNSYKWKHWHSEKTIASLQNWLLSTHFQTTSRLMQRILTGKNSRTVYNECMSYTIRMIIQCWFQIEIEVGSENQYFGWFWRFSVYQNFIKLDPRLINWNMGWFLQILQITHPPPPLTIRQRRVVD